MPPPLAIPSWQRPDLILSGVGVLVAVLTLICVLYQLRLERRQTRLAERQNEIVEKQNAIIEAERARRTAIVMFRRDESPIDFRFYLKNVGDKVAREFVASFWLPETIRPTIGMWDPGGNIQLRGPVEREEIQGIWCLRYERTFETILIGDSQQGAFYFSIQGGQTLPPGSRVFWSVITVEAEKSPGEEPGVIELA